MSRANASDGHGFGGVTSGFIVSDATAILLVLLALAGIALNRPLLSALGAVVLVLTLVARIWTRLSLNDVSYRCETSLARVVEGDDLELTLTLENRKPLPVPWVCIHEPIPDGLELVDAVPTQRTAFGSTLLVTTTSLGSNQRVRIRFRLRARRRGHYVLGPGRLTSGDPFGFYESDRVVLRTVTHLLVYPRIVAAPDLLLPLARPIGDRIARSRLTADRTLPVTAREFGAGDSLRDVDWKLTAKRDAPWVRVNDDSVDGSVVLLLECETRTHGVWSESPDLLETAIRTVAALANELLQRGHAVGLITNGVPPGDQARSAVAPACGAEQLTRLMDALARVQLTVVKPLSEIVERHASRALPYGATVVGVASVVNADLVGVLRARRSHGTRVLLINAGDDDHALDGIRTIHWQASDDAPVDDDGRRDVPGVGIPS